MNNLLQEYSRTFTLVFHVISKRTQNHLRNEKLTSLCTEQGHLHDQSVVLKEDIFQHHRKKLLLVGNYTRRLWVWRMKIFLMKVNVTTRTLESSSSNVSIILIFQKMTIKYNKTFIKKIYILKVH